MLIKGKGVKTQYRFPFEVDLLLKDLKTLKRENRILGRENQKQKQDIFSILEVVIKLLSENKRAPNHRKLRRTLGVDITKLYPLHPLYRSYKDLTKLLGLRIGRRRRKTKT